MSWSWLTTVAAKTSAPQRPGVRPPPCARLWVRPGPGASLSYGGFGGEQVSGCRGRGHFKGKGSVPAAVRRAGELGGTGGRPTGALGTVSRRRPRYGPRHRSGNIPPSIRAHGAYGGRASGGVAVHRRENLAHDARRRRRPLDPVEDRPIRLPSPFSWPPRPTETERSGVPVPLLPKSSVKPPSSDAGIEARWPVKPNFSQSLTVTLSARTHVL